jgi:hypothetical protein
VLEGIQQKKALQRDRISHLVTEPRWGQLQLFSHVAAQTTALHCLLLLAQFAVLLLAPPCIHLSACATAHPMHIPVFTLLRVHTACCGAVV